MRRMVRMGVAAAAILVLVPAAPAQMAQEAVDMDAVERIRVEGLENSQIEELAGHLMDVIGPRLTNSPGMTRANEWTAEMLEEWGLANVQIEPWGEFGRGWERVSYSGRILTPFVQPLVAQPSGWTGSTQGTVTGPAVIIEADSVADLEKYRGQLAGAWVLSRPADSAGGSSRAGGRARGPRAEGSRGAGPADRGVAAHEGIARGHERLPGERGHRGLPSAVVT